MEQFSDETKQVCGRANNGGARSEREHTPQSAGADHHVRPVACVRIELVGRSLNASEKKAALFAATSLLGIKIFFFK